MRGTPADRKRIPPPHGIIPAYAGNTMAVMFSRIEVRDHPRVCGEHRSESHEGQRKQGSSPRMRGTPITLPLTVFIHGIIPAYAGNTQKANPYFAKYRDHPRVCGEHPYAFGDGDQFTGSSPRMRGTL